ncbi:carbohydrate-binding module family 63 protein [Lepidopterella palustris CBS 459.81]|uniref:Carbohydrate-binding module family 63 protein n=1 Tax=Lepidopterella palustris CBS 459.81 TaxID=1314670 RepID=A0A8E2EK25_9PEZI|nr:carbohydrate-binding module family 63 protein [Lepidopterella palustris CBS 459.81]
MRTPLVALAASLSLALAQSDFCSQHLVYVTITPTTTVTCGGTVYSTTTQTTTVTVKAAQAALSSTNQAALSAISQTPESTTTLLQTIIVQPSPIPTSATSRSVYYSNTTSSSLAQSSIHFIFVGDSTAQSAEATSFGSAAGGNAALTPSSSALTTVISSATSTSTPSAPVATSSSTTALSSDNAGQATYYGGNLVGGTCSFSTYTLPSGIFGTALSDSNWDSAGNCGACISVTGPSGNSITAMIVDQCPGCGTNHLDLFPDAFSALADPGKGVIDVTWDIVPCGISSPLSLRNKEGTSKYWFSMQVINSNIPVSKLEVSTDGGSTWASTTRQSYNFFENSSGFGTDTVDVRVTSSTGETIVVQNVGVASGTTFTASENFS